jgi:hypothetical protein
MSAQSSTRLLDRLRRVARPSTIARAAWLIVAAVHVWLVLERCLTGEWATPLDFTRAALCLAGVAYASLKFWRIATIFDSSLRRAVACGLILLIGHWVIAPPAGDAGPAAASDVTALIAVVPALGAALLAALLLGVPRRRTFARPPRVAAAPPTFELGQSPLFFIRFFPSLFHRPPPRLA